MTDAAESDSRMPGRINDSHLSRVGVTATTVLTAASVVAVTAGVIILAANSIDAQGEDPFQGERFQPIGPSFAPEIVAVGRNLFIGGTTVLAASGLLGLLARFWRRGPLLPVLHVLLAVAVAVATFWGAALLQAFFIVLAYPFPVLALAVAAVWSTTLYPVQDASPEQLPHVRYRMRRRIDVAVAIAVGVGVGVQSAAPLFILLVLLFTGS